MTEKTSKRRAIKKRAGRRNAVDLPTGTVTFLFTDIEGSTVLWENYPTQMEAALARHDQILRAAVEANGGYVFKTVGDAFCAAFATAKEAIEATLAAQRALQAEPWDEECRLCVRAALHTGVAEERDGDYFGPPVNRVARLLSAGHGAQVLLSDATYNLVRDVLPHLEPGASLRDLGEHRLKDLRYTERIYQLSVPDLPETFPPLKTHGLITPTPEPATPATGQDEGAPRHPAPLRDERYRRQRLMGSGGMAEVYLSHDEVLDRDVALKVLRKQYADDQQFVERFKREAKNVASLSHPNIAAVYDRGETKDGSYYIVMECVPGGTLKEHIEKEGALPPSEALEFTVQIAAALEAAHRRGVIHRDIKPQNVLLTERGEAKVADFGIARAATSTTITRAGGMLGTPHYFSPEQAQGEPATPQSDLYSLGVVLYEMLTGQVPFEAETPIGIVMQHVSGPLRAPKEVNPDVPEGLNAVCVRLLAKDPKERYQNAADLIEDLERVRRGELAQQEPLELANTLGEDEVHTLGDDKGPLSAPAGGQGTTSQQGAKVPPPSGADTNQAGPSRDLQDSSLRSKRVILLASIIGVLLLLATAGGALALGLVPVANVGGVPDQQPANEGSPAQKATATESTKETTPSAPSSSSASQPNTEPAASQSAPPSSGTAPDNGSVSQPSKPEPSNPEPKQKPVAVPNVVGFAHALAAKTLTDAGFDSTSTPVDSDKPQGTVVSTEPQAGTLKDPASTTVILKESTGPKTTTPSTTPGKTPPPTPQPPGGIKGSAPAEKTKSK